MNVTINQPFPVQVLVADGNPTFYAQAVVRDDLGVTLATIDLANEGGGLYGATYTPTSLGDISIIYYLYVDLARTVLTTFYGLATESFSVTQLIPDTHETWQINGLDPANPMTNTVTSRKVPADGSIIDQTLTDGAGTVTVQRT